MEQAIPSESAGQPVRLARRWQFADFLLDESTMELSHRGASVPIERKPLKVLIHLLEHADELVTKEALQAEVWPGRILSDTVLTKAVGRLREVLHDSEQSIIKTVHGFGYRFIAPLQMQTLVKSPMVALKDLHEVQTCHHLPVIALKAELRSLLSHLEPKHPSAAAVLRDLIERI